MRRRHLPCMATICPCSVPMAAAWVLMVAVVLLLIAASSAVVAVVIWVSIGVMAFSAVVKMVVAWVACPVVRVSRRVRNVHLTGDDGGDIRRVRAAGAPAAVIAVLRAGSLRQRAMVVNAAIDASLVMDFFMSVSSLVMVSARCACIPIVHGECRKLACGTLRKHKGAGRKCAKNGGSLSRPVNRRRRRTVWRQSDACASLRPDGNRAGWRPRGDSRGRPSRHLLPD